VRQLFRAFGRLPRQSRFPRELNIIQVPMSLVERITILPELLVQLIALRAYSFVTWPALRGAVIFGDWFKAICTVHVGGGGSGGVHGLLRSRHSHGVHSSSCARVSTFILGRITIRIAIQATVRSGRRERRVEHLLALTRIMALYEVLRHHVLQVLVAALLRNF